MQLVPIKYINPKSWYYYSKDKKMLINPERVTYVSDGQRPSNTGFIGMLYNPERVTYFTLKVRNDNTLSVFILYLNNIL